MKTFNYCCGCFMIITKNGCGIGKECSECKDKQSNDKEEYTGLKEIPFTLKEVKDETSNKT